jgi:hypothetical protein
MTEDLTKLESEMRRKVRREIGIKEKLREASLAIRDIAPLPTNEIDWDRRKAGERDLKQFCEIYLKNIFSRPWSDSHLSAIHRLEQTSLGTGLFALAMPRGEGKTSTAIGSCIWDQAYGHRQYIYFIGSDQEQANDRLQVVKDEWYFNEILRQDFPEIGYPPFMAEGRNELTKGQRFNKRTTKLSWGTDEIHFASLVLTYDQIEPYIENGLDHTVIPLDEEGEWWSFINNGAIMKVKGIGGNIRGALYRKPLTGEILRPDKVILDDVQTDKVAENPTSVRKMVRHIDGAIKGLADPTIGISGVNLCTVRSDGDVSETYLDKVKKPEWHPQRCSIVNAWPEGITDLEITDKTEESTLWQLYADLRNDELKESGTHTQADQLYADNREVMDRGFIVDNPHRFSPREGEISAQQHAMNLRLYDLVSFMSEYMNKPVREMASGTVIVNAETVNSCIIEAPRYSIPIDCTELCAFIDVGDELLWYGVMAGSRKFTTHCPDYGTWPNSDGYITKAKARKSRLLTRAYLKKHPQHRRKDSDGSRAPQEAKIYWALTQLIGQLRNTKFINQSGQEMYIGKIGIDAGWGKLTKTIYRLIYDLQDPNIFPAFGRFIGATSQQLSDYGEKPGQFIGEHLIVRPPSERDMSVDGTVYPIGHMLVDANWWKSFLWNRFATPLGSNFGTITLFNGVHEMLVDHITNAEYPMSVTARNLTVDEWQAIPGQDNDLMDVFYNLMAMLSLVGCTSSDFSELDKRLSTTPQQEQEQEQEKDSQPTFTVQQLQKRKTSEPAKTKKIGKRTFKMRSYKKR